MRPQSTAWLGLAKRFQSTHPLRGATANRRVLLLRARNFNPRTPCGVRLTSPHEFLQPSHFNPRTPCGVRPEILQPCIRNGEFQSTHPLRGATPFGYIAVTHFEISIHAPLAGCDCHDAVRSHFRPDFNPRTPCGVRRIGVTSLFTGVLFQSTHPLRGATSSQVQVGHKTSQFQSTHPLRGATSRIWFTR